MPSWMPEWVPVITPTESLSNSPPPARAAVTASRRRSQASSPSPSTPRRMEVLAELPPAVLSESLAAGAGTVEQPPPQSPPRLPAPQLVDEVRQGNKQRGPDGA